MSFEKWLVLAAIAAMLLGPQRLPLYAEKLGVLVRNLRSYADNARERMRDEMGAEVFDEIDWKKLDPRQYDPRRIIRDALLDDDSEPVVSAPSASTAEAAGEAATVVGLSSVATKPAPARLTDGERPPFDSEAT
ncbi:Sec-independent protein translocase family protein [Gryllotalpicola ginsengisoli]|uniref:translocase n=1 Tax=Gryllotalpicola ginsengisoli TaxID=444608 RepID=UPI0003B3A568|nr:translocase [Gryllotalpicola ginsengisoli]